MSGDTHRDALIITCSKPDALPFLLSLPPGDLGQATLVATGDVVRAAERQSLVAVGCIIGGVTAVEEVRHLTGDSTCHVAVIVAPDPWGPFRGKGFVRARLLAPWFIGPGARADLIELRGDGHSYRTLPGLSRKSLMLRLYTREAWLLTEYLVGVGVGRPTGRMATLVSRAGGRPLGRAATLFSLPRALVGALLALPVAAITMSRLLPFILWNEARARMKVGQR